MEKVDPKLAFEKAYELYAGAILRFIYFKVSDYACAEDLTAETFIRFWRRVSAGKVIQNERALLYVIARGLVIDHYRKSNRKILPLAEVEEQMLTEPMDIQKTVELKEQVSQLLSAMGKLRQEYREALHMYYVEELTVPEISTILEKNENAVRVLIHRALKALKKMYD